MLVVRPRACFQGGVFRDPKNGTLKTNKPPAMQVSPQTALALSKKLQSYKIWWFANRTYCVKEFAHKSVVIIACYL